SELAYGDRVDVFNNRTGKGSFFNVTAAIRPHPRAELEYRIDNDLIDTREEVAGSKRILLSRGQQAIGIWHFSARDRVRAIWQAVSTRRSPSLWEDPVSPHDKTETLSLVYGHVRRLGAALYLGANFTRTRDPSAGVKRDQSELFAKGQWTFD